MVVCTRPGPSNLILTPVWRVRALFLCPSTTRKFFVCLPYFVNRRDPAHTSTSFFLPDSQPLSGLFKAKRWGGLKASLSKPHPKVWEGLSHPNHSSWLPEPKLLRPRRGMWSVGTDWGHLLWGCVGHVSLWHSLCLLERRKWGIGYLHLYPPSSLSNQASCHHDREHGHCGGTVGYLSSDHRGAWVY
jgi:hypothetical protein